MQHLHANLRDAYQQSLNTRSLTTAVQEKHNSMYVYACMYACRHGCIEGCRYRDTRERERERESERERERVSSSERESETERERESERVDTTPILSETLHYASLLKRYAFG